MGVIIPVSLDSCKDIIFENHQFLAHSRHLKMAAMVQCIYKLHEIESFGLKKFYFHRLLEKNKENMAQVNNKMFILRCKLWILVFSIYLL